ncbi:S1 family peptidase [Rhodocaloribacter litoris]|uniref:S1 family peptidase n=1 Tax=Rhodocaloribacter litoris TaxID=2558931 RepID=UPI001E3B47C5|nr:S1 family peptidase [Rhodocaloribacter litoris]QXD13948.1 S1 family peptidase [Rhodocaloribacter litoris]
MEIDDKSRDAYLSKEIPVQPGAYSFTELAVHRDLIERNLRDAIPLVLTDVDERRNVVVIGLDETANISIADVISKMARLGVPPEAVVFERMPIPQAAIDMSPDPKLPTSTLLPQLTDYVRPLAGGLKIDRNGGCTLGIPVWYGNPGNQTRGFLTASHCTGFVGYNNGSQWGQPLLSNAIGVEFEDPPLTNCGSGYCDLTDAALIDLNSAHDNSSMALPGHVYLTDFSSSTGPGGYAVTGETLPLGVQSPFMGLDVNKVGVRTGWTTGEITGTCVTTYVVVRHPDGVQRLTRLPCYIRATTPVNSGDSGSALFRIVYDPDPDGGNFLGILSACSGCNPDVTSQTGDGFYVSWSAISQAMNQHITMVEDQGIE